MLHKQERASFAIRIQGELTGVNDAAATPVACLPPVGWSFAGLVADSYLLQAALAHIKRQAHPRRIF
jgi:hypothetical protein